MDILAAWLGNADLRGSTNNNETDTGPIAQALAARSFNRVLLLTNQKASDVQRYLKWLKGRRNVGEPSIDVEAVKLTSPTNMSEIHRAAVAALDRLLSEAGTGSKLTLFLSPGTPAMAAVWILLGKTRFPARFLESSREGGVRDADVPFDISAEFLPAIFDGPDKRLAELSAEEAADNAQFGDIVCKSSAMKRLISKARKAAARTVTVLIEGESGTGKELLANAIANSGPRKDKVLRVINCGAIPSELLESELFGHMKGSFTGALKDRAGYFEEAHGGTLFLDEVGELPPLAQVKLLRVLQDGKVTRIGESSPRSVDVRVIAATNRSLADEVANGRFREDLFYRLAQIVLKVPPVRDRQGDHGILIDHLLHKINQEHKDDPAAKPKTLSASARNLLLRQPWRGNVRELQSTIRRAVIWSDGDVISADDVREALLPDIRRGTDNDQILPPLETGVDLNEILDTVAARYLDAALEKTAGNKTRAAGLLGLKSQQTLSNWVKKKERRQATRNRKAIKG